MVGDSVTTISPLFIPRYIYLCKVPSQGVIANMREPTAPVLLLIPLACSPTFPELTTYLPMLLEDTHPIQANNKSATLVIAYLALLLFRNGSQPLLRDGLDTERK